jgi:uncharacterized protein
MRWQGGRRSGNVQDRRGMGTAVGGGVGVVVLALIAMLFGVDPRVLLDGGGAGAPPAEAPGLPPAGTDERADFAAVILGSTEDVWRGIFASHGGRYRDPTLVLFEGAVQSRCGMAGAAVGPFYCPLDETLYLDLGFFDDLGRLGAPGEFARAYVIAHEVGHHVQTLLGVTGQVQDAGRSPELSVRFELQADCLAGVWGHHARGMLEPGDVEDGLRAAAAIGDDRLSGGRSPETFTHGTAAQRAEWLRRGLERGEPEACETFAAARI